MAQVVPLADDVLVDRDGAVALARAEDGALSCIAAATGASCWTNPALARPVGLHDGVLVAQRSDAPTSGILLLATVDVATGEIIQPIEVPLGGSVTPLLADGPAARFDLYVVTAGPVMTVEWVWNRTPLRGAHPAATETETVRRSAELDFGRFDLDLATGLVVPIPIAEPLERTPRFEEVSMVVGAPGRQFAEPSGTLVLASELDDPEAWDRYAWRIHDIGGALLGGLRSHWSLTPFSVGDGTVVVIEPLHVRPAGDKNVSNDLSLVGYDLDTGDELWRVPLLDRTYRGPLPS